MSSLWDDAQADRITDSLSRPAAKPARFTEWSDNSRSFRDGGYLARVLRQTCRSCSTTNNHLEGIFHVEIAPNGTRRMTALAANAQWPIQEWPVEVVATELPLCPACLRSVGFEREVPAPGVFSLLLAD